MALTPPVWRHHRSRPLVLAAFAAATTAGGTTTAIGLWLLTGLSAPLPAVVRSTLFAAVGLALILRAVGAVHFPLPQAARQIPQDVFRDDPLRAAVRFGYPFGTGVRTYLVNEAPYAVTAAIVLLRPPLAGAAALGVGFGLARGLLPVGRLLRRPRRATAQG